MTKPSCAKEASIWVTRTLLKIAFILQLAPTKLHFQLGEVIQDKASFCIVIIPQCFLTRHPEFSSGAKHLLGPARIH